MIYNTYMIILCGPSASGKTEIAKLLIKNFEFKKFVTTTTREKRIGEVDDVDYHFISRDLFEQYIKENKFIEYVNYNNNYYGTYKNEISDDKVLIVEPEGLKTFIKLENKNIVTFFIDANDKVRNKRMIERGDKEVDIKKRLDNDGDIFNKGIKNICTFVIENNGEKTLEELTENIFSHYKNALKK